MEKRAPAGDDDIVMGGAEFEARTLKGTMAETLKKKPGLEVAPEKVEGARRRL